MKVEWFCKVMGSEVGPLSQAELIDMVRHQKITPEDLVRRNGSSWVAAFEVQGLFAAAARPAKLRAEEPLEAPVEVPEAALPQAVSTSPQPSPEVHRVDASEGGPHGSDWYCIASGEKRGPIAFEALKALMDEGRLRQTDRVWRSSSPKFCRASEIEGLHTG